MSFNPCDGNCTSNLPPECCNSDNPYFARGYTPLECINKVNEGVRHNYNSIKNLYRDLYHEKCCSKIFYPDDVIKMESGVYTRDDNTVSSYYIITVKNRDKENDLVEFKLYPANGNMTNTGLTEDIFSANTTILPNLSFGGSVGRIGGWYGNAIINGSVVPTSTSADAQHYPTFGFTINGTLKCYPIDTDIDILIADGIQNSMGCDGFLIQNGNIIDPLLIANKNLKRSRICIGQTNDLTTYVLVCGTGTEANNNGLTSAECAEILNGFNCLTAVEVVSDMAESNETTYTTAYGTFKGQVITTPFEDTLKPNDVYWYVSLKDKYENKYECELANLYMTLGKYAWIAFKNIFDPSDIEAAIALNSAAITTLNTAIENITSGDTVLPYIKKNNGTGTGTTKLNDVAIERDLDVSRDVSIDGYLYVNGQESYLAGTNVAGELDVIGNTNVTNLEATGNTQLNNTEVDGTLDVTGNTALQGNTVVGGTLDVIGNTALQGNTVVGGTLNVSGETTVNNRANINGNLVVNSNAGFVCEGTTQVPENPPTSSSIASKIYVDTKIGDIVSTYLTEQPYGTQTAGTAPDNIVFTMSSYNYIPYVRVTAPDVSAINNYAITLPTMVSYLRTILQDGETLYLTSGFNAITPPYATINIKIVRTGDTFKATVIPSVAAERLENILFMGIYLP